MKRRYLLLSVIIILFTSGCSAEYNIDINGSSVDESLSVYESNSSNWNKVLDNNIISFSDYYDIYKDADIGIYYDDQNLDNEIGRNANREYYDITTFDNSNGKGILLNGNFTFSKYEDSYILRNCYDSVNVLNSSSSFSISTSGENTCMNYVNGIDKIVVNIKSIYNVVDSNASSVSNNVYTWVITKNNYKNSNIYIKLDKDTLSSSSQDNKTTIVKEAGNYFIYLLIVLVIALIIYLVYRWFMKNSNKKNEI